MTTIPVAWTLALVLICIPIVIILFVAVHATMDSVCVRHARGYCTKNGLEIHRIRFQPAFDRTGVKTESTLFQVDCRDAKSQRRLVVLLVWPFGVREILGNNDYPDSYDEKWPQTSRGEKAIV
jgi:hypothetical protein